MKKVIYLFSILFLALIVNSCSNFLSGSDLKTEIDDAIAYANADPFIVLFTSKKGGITPSGNIECKESQQISAYFSANNDYYFKHWQVSLDNVVLTQEQAAQYVKIYDYEKPVTTIKILKKVDNLKIDAECGERPAVLEGFPRYESSGVNRDCRISVMFSRVMDESSIYFSEEELKTLSIISKNESLETLINSATETEDHVKSKTGHEIIVDVKKKTCYGYQTNPKDDQTIVFKNVEIYKRISSENLLRCYKAPYFDESDGSILRIDAKNSEDEAPTAYTEVVVKVLQDMCIMENDEQIYLVKQHYWPYLTNNATDTVNPLFSSLQVSLKSDSAEEVLLQTSSISTESISKYNLKNKKLWIMGKIYDEHSGPDTVSWTVKSLKTSNYADNQILASGYVQGLVYSGNDAFFGSDNESTGGCEIDLSKVIATGTQGCYELSFTASDKVNNQTTTEKYYFVYDDVPPVKPTVSYSYSKGKTVCFNYSTTDKDVAKLKFVNTIDNSSSETTNKTSFSITTLENNTKYIFEITTVDYAGNESEVIMKEEQVGAAVGQYVYYDNNAKTIFTSLQPIDLTFNKNIKLAGVVYDISDLSKVKLINTENVYLENGIPSGFIDIASKTSTSEDDGLITYKTYKDKNYDFWKSLVTLNSGTYSNKIIWYLPSEKEMEQIIENRTLINTALGKVSCYNTQHIYSGQYRNTYFTSTARFSNGWHYTVFIYDESQNPTSYSSSLYYRRIAQLNMNY